MSQMFKRGDRWMNIDEIKREEEKVEEVKVKKVEEIGEPPKGNSGRALMTNEELYCKECGKQFKKKVLFESHIQNKHLIK